MAQLRRFDPSHPQLPPFSAEPFDLTGFEARESWDEETRRLFRRAVQEGRAGNVHGAVASLDTLLDSRPNLPEALRLRGKLLELREAHEFDELDEVITVEAPAEPWHALKIALAGCAGLALAIGAVALIPLPHSVTTAATLVPIASADVSAPRSGTVATVPVAVGQWVEKDAVLFTYDVNGELHQLEGAVARLDELNRNLYTQLPRTKQADDARARHANAEARVKQVDARLDEARQQGRDFLTETEEQLNDALSEAAAAHEALDAMVPEAQRLALSNARSEVQELEMQLLQNEVKAPLAGAVTMLSVQPGSQVLKGLGAARIDDARQLKAVARVGAEDRRGLAVGQPVLLISNGRATNNAISSLEGGKVELLIDNSAQTFQAGPAELQIRGKPVPLVGR